MPSVRCRILVQGHLGNEWSDWFGGLAITHAEDNTLLSSPLPDQAALYGLLIKLRDLGLTLLRVEVDDR